MATYVYRCEYGHVVEVKQNMSDEPLTECTHEDEDGRCHGKAARMIQPVGVTYKGSGFHCTDYGKSGRNSPTYKDYVNG